MYRSDVSGFPQEGMTPDLRDRLNKYDKGTDKIPSHRFHLDVSVEQTLS